MLTVLPIGAKVVIAGEIKGTIISMNIRQKDAVTYHVATITSSGYTEIWVDSFLVEPLTTETTHIGFRGEHETDQDKAPNERGL